MIDLFEVQPMPWIRGELAMLTAMLKQGVLDLTHTDSREEAVEWFTDERDENEVGSLAWVCDHLDLDKGYVRKRVREFMKREVIV